MKIYTFTRALLIASCLFTFSLLIARGQAATALSAAEKQQLLSVRESVWTSWYKNDQAQLRFLVPPALIAINPGEDSWKSQAEFLASAQEFAKHHGRLVSLEFPKTEIQVFGTTAVLYSLYRGRFEYDGQAQLQNGRATEIFVREHGQWVNPGWHLDSGK